MQKLFNNSAALLIVAAMAAVATAQPATFTDLGNIGTAGSFTFDTVGSAILPAGTNPGGALVDTELALWDAAGVLLDENDDDPSIPSFQSQIVATLGPGTYFLGIGEFNATFADNFVNTGTGFEAGESANIVLNVLGSLGPLSGSAVAGDDGSGFEETAFFQVTVSAIPEPTTGVVIAMGGLIGLSRRRRR